MHCQPCRGLAPGPPGFTEAWLRCPTGDSKTAPHNSSRQGKATSTGRRRSSGAAAAHSTGNDRPVGKHAAQVDRLPIGASHIRRTHIGGSVGTSPSRRLSRLPGMRVVWRTSYEPDVPLAPSQAGVCLIRLRPRRESVSKHECCAIRIAAGLTCSMPRDFGRDQG